MVRFREEISRCSFISWTAFLGRLPTRDRLISWGVTVPSGCVLCSVADESISHMFFECLFCGCYLDSSLWQVHGVSPCIVSSNRLHVPAASRPSCFSSSCSAQASESSHHLQHLAGEECMYLHGCVFVSEGVLSCGGSCYQR